MPDAHRGRTNKCIALCYDPMSGGPSGLTRRASLGLILGTTHDQYNQEQSDTIMFDQTDGATQSD
jgi:hypothetical protein